MVSGSGLYLKSVPDSVAQARQVVDQGMGWSGYFYAQASKAATASTDLAVKVAERDRLAKALRSSAFARPAAVPAMPWKWTAGVLSGAAVDGRTRKLVTDGSGWYAASLEPGRYTVRVTEPGAQARTVTVRVRAGAVSYLNLTAR